MAPRWPALARAGPSMYPVIDKPHLLPIYFKDNCSSEGLLSVL